MRKPIIGAVAIALAASLLASCGSRAERAGECHVGIYRLADGGTVDIAPAPEGLRWRRLDGRSGALRPGGAGVWTSTLGWTGRPEKIAVRFGRCSEGRIEFDGMAGRRAQLLSRETTFVGAGSVKLSGRLVLPPGRTPVPVVVMVHGSEKTPAKVRYAEQRLFPAEGVGVFVYDKRGTGRSGGRYTQDFHVLAADAAAAVVEARRLAGHRLGRIGLNGGSQGGWIAPLAAIRSDVDFVIARYGLAEGPLAEDRREVLQDVEAYGPLVAAKAKKVSAATAKLMSSNFKEGWAELAAVRRQYGAEPWFADVKGDWSGDVLKHPPLLLRIAGPMFSKGTTWTYDPMPALRRNRAPMLWLLASEDRSAPVDETRRRLVSLSKAGHPISVLEFPRTEHGVQEFVTVGGERKKTRYADGYFRAQLDFIRNGRLGASAYGSAIRLTP